MGKELAKILYGSQNYGLDTPSSDKDYTIIVMPTVEDVFDNKNLTGKGEMDYRDFFRLLLGGNPNMIELLTSKEMYFYDEKFEKFFLSLKYYTDNFIRSNWKTFTLALKGKVSYKKKITGKEYARFIHHYNLWKKIYEDGGELKSWVLDYKKLRDKEITYKEEDEVDMLARRWSPEILTLEPNCFDEQQLRYLRKKAIKFFKEYIKDDIQVIFPE
jgi:predicted nucleotidyltransferase